jgi:oligo-1,6-glucosidase
MAVYFENHDNPRMISKINPDPKYRDVLGKLLALLQLTLKGTPFIFQGQELGMVNVAFDSIDKFRDVESINLYNELLPKAGKDEALKKILCGSRDHARTPMQWANEIFGGFSSSEPWIFMGDDYKKHNIKDKKEDTSSILNFYRKLISLRKTEKVLVYGEFITACENKKDVFCYFREYKGSKYYVELNLSNKPLKHPLKCHCFELVLSNYEVRDNLLMPYEANLYRVK